MRKRLVGLLGVMLASSFVLASCGNKKNDNANNEPTGKGDWGAEEVSKNIEAQKQNEDPQEEVTPVVYNIAGNVQFDSEDIVNQNYAEYGLIVVRNDKGYIGFYSLNHNNYLLNKQYLEKVVRYDVIYDANVGYFLRIVYNDTLFIYDSLGNKVFESTSKVIDLSNLGNIYSRNFISSSYINKKVYLTITDEENETKYFEYTSTGTLSEIAALPQAQANNNKDTSPFNKNSQYVDLDKIDLKEFGFDGYYLSRKGELVTVFDKLTNEPKSTFTVPTGSTMVFVGSKLIYQNTYTTSEDATEYSYFNGQNKFVVETYSVDLLKGEKQALNLSYRIRNVYGPYMDALGVYSHALISKQTFENNILKSNEMVVIDEEGKIINNLNGYEPDEFVKIGSNYYNTSTKVLYDSSLKEIAYLEAIDPVMYEDCNCFIGTVKNKYGVVNSNGIVTVPFDYTELYTDYLEDGYVFGIKDGKLYRVEIKGGTETLLGTIYNKYNNYVYITGSKATNYNFEYVKNSLGNAIEADSYTVAGSSTSKTFDSNVIRFKTETIDNSGEQQEITTEYRFVNISSKNAANAKTYQAQGTEITTVTDLGEDRESAPTITLGENKMHMTESNGNYFKYTAEEDGYYNIPSYYKGYNVYVTAELYTAPENPNDDPTYTNVTVNQESFGKIVRLEKGKTYYFRISTGYTRHGTIYLDFEMEKGEHANYPVFHKLTDNQTFDYFEDGTYIELIVKGMGYYELSNPNNMRYELINYNSNYNPTGYSSGQTLNVITSDDLNLETTEDKTYFGLNEFTTYVIRVYKDNFAGESFTFGVAYAEDEKLNPVGTSVINPFVLETGDNDVNYNYLNYYTYHCTRNGKLRLSATNSNVFGTNYNNARIYEGEYSPSNYTYRTVVNGGVVEVKADTDYTIRLNRGSQTTDFVLNVEEIPESTTILTTVDLSYTGQRTVYFKPTINGNYVASLKVAPGDTLRGYDLYNRVLFEETADMNGELTYSQYLYRDAVYKFVVNTKSSKRFSVAQGNATTQYLLEGSLNTVYMNGSYTDNTFSFTPTEDGTYSFTLTNTDFNKFTMVDEKGNTVPTTSGTNNWYKVYVAELEAGVKYTITASASSGTRELTITEEYGQHWYAPITINAMEEFDATDFLAMTGEEDPYLYVKVYFPKAAKVVCEGFEKYGTSSTSEPSASLYGNQYLAVTDGSTYYLKAQITAVNTLVSTSLYEEEDVLAGTSIYKPIALTGNEGTIEGTAEAADEYFYYKVTNPYEAAALIEFDASVTNIGGVKVYDKNYQPLTLSNDGIVLLVDEAIIELKASAAGAFSIDYDITDYADYVLVDKQITLDTTTTKEEVEIVSADRLYVSISAKTTSEDETPTDTLTITVKDMTDNVVATATSVNGEVELSLTLNALRKYTIVFEGEGTFDIEYGYNPLKVTYSTDNPFTYDEDNERFTSTNTMASSEGSMIIESDAELTLSFDMIISCGINDNVTIKRTRNGSTSTLNTYYGNGSNGDKKVNRNISLQKGDIITITYNRSTSSTTYNDNKVIVYNLDFSETLYA